MPRQKSKNIFIVGEKTPRQRDISLKELAAHLNLSPTALLIVLNDAPAANSIPSETKDRIFEAAEKFRKLSRLNPNLSFAGQLPKLNLQNPVNPENNVIK